MTPEEVEAQVDLTVIRGDDASFDVVIKDSVGQTVNLTGGVLKFTARSRSSDISALINKSSAIVGQITFVDAIHGMATLKIEDSDTSPLYAPSTLVYDFEFTSAGGDVTTVLPAGVLTILRDITHP